VNKFDRGSELLFFVTSSADAVNDDDEEEEHSEELRVRVGGLLIISILLFMM
jgi:hypothetical protein